jgi:guanylate kinase
MQDNQIDILTTIAKPLIEITIKSIVVPKIEELVRKMRERKPDTQDVVSEKIEKNFEEYLTRTYKRCRSINILVFPNQQIDIEDIYIGLTLKCSKNNQIIKIDGFKPELIAPYQRVLISDTAGMGKSTLTKYLTIKIIEQNVGVPI